MEMLRKITHTVGNKSYAVHVSVDRQLFCRRSSFKNAQVQSEGNEEANKEVEFTRDREGMTK